MPMYCDVVNGFLSCYSMSILALAVRYHSFVCCCGLAMFWNMGD